MGVDFKNNTMTPNVEEQVLKIKCEKCGKTFPHYLPHGICDDCRAEMFKAKEKNK